MKSLAESLFDKDLVKSKLCTLYDLFGNHIIKFQHTLGAGLGWTHYYSETHVVRQWKKEGYPILSGGFARTTFPKDLQKFIAVILKNTVVTVEQLVKLPSDGNLDDRVLNDKLDEQNILYNGSTEDWGKNWCYEERYKIRIQIGCFDGDKQIGTKRYNKPPMKDNIEISIYSYSEKRPGFGSHIWTLLTDLSINDLKKLII